MKLLLLCVGKLRGVPVRVLCEDYLARLRRYGACEVEEVRAADGADPAAGKAAEGQRLLAALRPGDHVWVLDERGRMSTSPGLAAKLTELENRSTKRLTVILGGAYGLDEAVRRRGELLSLSSLTFAHELCRVVVLEQLYRARTIQRGEPYHH